jgi:MFS family permease
MRWQLGLGRENGLTFWAMVFLEAAFGSYFALWPLWIEDLGASIGLVGLLIGLGGVLRMFTIAPSAALARRFGLKRVIIVARLIASVGLVWAAFAQHWTWLLPTMLSMSIGEMVFPLISTSIAANAGPRRVRAFAIILTTGPSVSLLLTPLLAGGLVELWGLRAPFIAAALFSLISLGFFTRLRPVAIHDSSSATSGGYGAIVRLPGVRRLLVLQLATFFGLGLGTALLSNYLHDAAGYRESSVALLSSLTAVGSIAYSAVVARSTWFSGAPLRAIAIATAAAAVGYLLFLEAGQVSLVVVGFILRGGFFVAWPLFSAALGEATPVRLRPHAYALGEILSGTGFITAPVVAGQLYNVRPELPLICSAALILPLSLLLARTRVPHVEEPDLPEDKSGAAGAAPDAERVPA